MEICITTHVLATLKYASPQQNVFCDSKHNVFTSCETENLGNYHATSQGRE